MRKRRNEKNIYEVALKQFSKNGYKKTTLDDIAEKLNMTNANLYGYAISKQALYHDSVAYAMTKWQNKVYDAIRNIENPVEKLTTLCDSAVLYLSEDKIFCQILKADHDIFPMFPTIDPYEEINKRSFDMLKEVLQEGITKGDFIIMDAEKSAQIIFAIYKALIIEAYIQSDDDSVLETYNETKKIFLRGIISNRS